MPRRLHRNYLKIKLMPEKENSEMPDGFDHQAFLSIDSTNKEAVRQLEKGAKSGLWLTATEQLLGRGRGGREWISKPGNLFSSLIFDTKKSLCHSAQLSFVTSLAVCETVGAFVEAENVKCKWPNDVLVNGNKISGILLETYSGQNTENLMIIGIGINIEHHPEKPLYPTTHINENSRININAEEVFHVLVEKMAYWLNNWQKNGFSIIRQEWLNKAKGKGENIIVRLPNEELNGRFVDLDANGALMLDMNGEMRLIHSGDVFFADQREEK